MNQRRRTILVAVKPLAVAAAMLMVFLICMCAYSAEADAATTHTSKDKKWEYEIVNKKKKTVRLTCYVTENKKDYAASMTIPSQIVGDDNVKYTVTEISGDREYYDDGYDSYPLYVWNGSGLIDGAKTITAVTIPKTVTAVGPYTFMDVDITSVKFASGSKCTSIGEYAFGWSDITSISIPASVTTIGEGAFEYSSLKKITFAKGSKLEKVGKEAFLGCELTKLELPSTVSSLGDDFISHCLSLKSFVIPASVKKIGTFTFDGVHNVSISFASGSKCTSIASYAFSEDECFFDGELQFANLSAFKIPSTVTSIGKGAFEDNTTLKSVTIPAGVKNLKLSSAFSGYTSLATVSFAEGTTAVPAGFAKNFKSLKNVSIPKSVTSVGDSAFSGCTSLTKVTFAGGSKCAKIGRYSFSATKISGIALPSGLKSIGKAAFYDCTKLSSVTLPAAVTTVGDYSFYGCTALKTVSSAKGSKLTTVGDAAFFGCTSLTGLGLPSSVTGLGDAFIGDCTSLKSFVIPASVNKINSCTFFYNNNTSVTFASGSKCTTISDYAFAAYADDAHSFYNEMTAGWIDSARRVILTSFKLPTTITQIGAYAFSGNKTLKSITIPAGAKNSGSLGTGVFSDCTALSSITLSDGVTSIPNSFASNCTALKSVVIPKSVSQIDNYAFENCSAVASITFKGDKLSAIPRGFASGCTSLKGITIPANVRSLETGCFSGCDSLASMTFAASAKCTIIDNESFAGCKSLKKIDIPASVTQIGARAFIACSRLATINILSDTLSQIGGCAFAIYAYNSDSGAAWYLWKRSSPFDGIIYVNNQSVRNKIISSGEAPADKVAVRKYNIGFMVGDGKTWSKKTQVSVGYNDAFKISTYAPKAPTGYTYVWYGASSVAYSGTGKNTVTYAINAKSCVIHDSTRKNVTGCIHAANTARAGGSNGFTGSQSLSRLTKNGTLFLCAEKVEKSYSVKYNANGGSGTMTDSSDWWYFSSYNLRANAFTRNGYIFGGWNTKANGTGTVYKDKASVKSLTESASITLYAMWKKQENLVYYMPESMGNGRITYSGIRRKAYTGDNISAMTYAQAAAAMKSEAGVSAASEITLKYIDGDEKLKTITKSITDIADIKGWRKTTQTADRFTQLYPGHEEGDYTDGANVVMTGALSLAPAYVYKNLTISFDSSLAENTMADVVCQQGNIDISELKNTLTRSGYGFAGWTVKQKISDSGTDVLISQLKIENGSLSESDIYSLYMYADSNLKVELIPVWGIVDTYKVQFDSNGGVGRMETAVLQCGRKEKLPECTLTKDGAVFEGWIVGEEIEVSYSDGAEIERSAAEGDLKLKASWKYVEYTIEYDANGGDGYMQDDTVVSGTSHTLQKNKYVMEGKTFLEWNTKNDGTGDSYEQGAKIKYAADEENEKLVLYAIWNENSVTLRFNANGGNVAKKSKKVHFGETCGNMPKPTRDGYEFKGWYTRRKGGSQFSSDTVIDTDCTITLYARWEALEYTASFDKNEGDSVSQSSRKVKVGSALGTLPTASRTGYSFEGWYTARTGGSKVNGVYKIDKDTKFYAHWKALVRQVKVTVSISQVKSATGYQLQYSASSSFNGAVTLSGTIQNSSSATYTRIVSNLEPGTTYYFRARSYSVKNGKTIYGSWGSVLSKTTAQ